MVSASGRGLTPKVAVAATRKSKQPDGERVLPTRPNKTDPSPPDVVAEMFERQQAGDDTYLDDLDRPSLRRSHLRDDSCTEARCRAPPSAVIDSEGMGRYALVGGLAAPRLCVLLMARLRRRGWSVVVLPIAESGCVCSRRDCVPARSRLGPTRDSRPRVRARLFDSR